MAKEVVVHGLGQAADSDSFLVLLREADGKRYLAIGIGQLEATAIAAALAGVRPPRPMTHDLLCSALAATGAQVTQVILHALIGGVFHARLVLDVSGRHAELDSRASDAIAVALRVGVPVQVEENVLAEAGVVPQRTEDADAPEPGASGTPGAAERVSEEQLGAFRDVIRGLNLDDLGKPGKSG
jgi:bifunctional DNase/RNase